MVAFARPSPPPLSSKIFATLPFVLFSWYLIFRPLLGYLETPASRASAEPSASSIGTTTADWQNRAFLFALLAITLLLALANWSRLNFARLRSPPIMSLAAFLLFAGASVTWAYSREISFNRYCLELMVLTPIILPFAMGSPARDTVRSLYWCYALAILINVIVVLNQKPMMTPEGTIFGYFGYFGFKQYLGQCASAAILLSFYEVLFSGWRRYLAILIAIASVFLVFASESKGSLVFMLVAPCIAGVAILISGKLRVSALLVLLAIPATYIAASMVSSTNLVNRISYMIYGDSTLTGRTVIWDFIHREIAQRPWFGWGFRSFWLVGNDAPSVTQAPYWVKHMTGSHSGYLDVKIETGVIGYWLFLIFIMATLYAIERVRRRDPLRAWILLSLALYVTITNLIETLWLSTNDPMWFLFVLVAAETTRYSAVPKANPTTTRRHGPVRKSGPIRRGGLPQGVRTVAGRRPV
ncbi:O-antigen ligase family protein [Hyphomicrobium sp.]|uniref:O-antigen ligase family protein n=1 Tax=Hyphomicrobium sp. TaxID=82 RepID=UPI000FBAD923|nr:O-antigen ligase family protein [Hyphomicrobium sp.]RUP10152.1 MAG: O-antigen ligase family protein [Hyphomicrobium sp.]